MGSTITTSFVAPLSVRLTRRSALTQVAGAGALAALIPTGAFGRQASAASSLQSGVTMSQSTPAATPSESPVTVVLVHGAFADSSSWSALIPLLTAEGLIVQAVANPLRGGETDAGYLAAIVSAIPGPVLLVGHSYGGAVISSIPAEVGNVIGLVYVAAFAPDEGESGLDILGNFPPTMLATNLHPVTADEANPDLNVTPATFHEVFAADLPAEDAAVMAVTQRPVAGAAFATPAGPPAWKRLPSWYVVATQDNVIGTEALRFQAERAGSITIEVESSHVVMLSHPDAVADLIFTAVGSLA